MNTNITVLNLRELRAALARRGMPQWRLAADLGISPSTFSSYVQGRAEPPPNLMQRIAKVLGIGEKDLSP